jgi:hypothetical protein
MCTVLLCMFSLCVCLPVYLIFERAQGTSLDILTRLWAGQSRDGLVSVTGKKCFFSSVPRLALGPIRLSV